MINEKAMIRLWVGPDLAHCGGNLVSGGFAVGLFNDVATELLIRLDGDEGLFYGTMRSSIWRLCTAEITLKSTVGSRTLDTHNCISDKYSSAGTHLF